MPHADIFAYALVFNGLEYRIINFAAAIAKIKQKKTKSTCKKSPIKLYYYSSKTVEFYFICIWCRTLLL